MEFKIGTWPENIHDDLDQIKRISSGLKLKKKILDLDLGSSSDAPVAVIKGSAMEPYVATLDSCTCADFVIRNKPCKHIYCLADQLGLLDGLPVYDKKKSNFDASRDLARYHDLFESGQIRMDDYLKIGSVLEKLKK